MDIDEIKTLTELMVENDLAEIMIRTGDKRIVLRRARHAADLPVPQPTYSHPPIAPPAAAPPPAAPVPPPQDPFLKVTSPMVGTYYASPAPDAPAFIKIGDRITAESVVCIIEAMKVFNEIKADVAGIVESIDVQNGAAVEFGQVLLRVRSA